MRENHREIREAVQEVEENAALDAVEQAALDEAMSEWLDYDYDDGQYRPDPYDPPPMEPDTDLSYWDDGEDSTEWVRNYVGGRFSDFMEPIPPTEST